MSRNQSTEKLQVLAGELLDTVKKLVKDGSVRRIVIRDETGRTRATIPLNLGVGVGAAALVVNPVLALVAGAAAAIGAPMAKYTVEIERTDLRSESVVDSSASPAQRAPAGFGSPVPPQAPTPAPAPTQDAPSAPQTPTPAPEDPSAL